ncbi:MAG TPA: hypothetical protein DD405_05355 [Desulfobacteraceae bacterium]|nr:hypothetical protein [Desulfobacteraceae bacterium]
MKKYHHIFICLMAIFLLVICFPFFPLSAADTKIAPTAKPGSGKIHVTADRLIIDQVTGCAEFTGNVKTVRKTTVVTSDRLEIFYKKSVKAGKKETAANESISRIVATGNVEIIFDNEFAKTDRAVYAVKTETLVLSGNSSVTRENTFVTGAKIIIYVADGRIKVDSSDKKPVKVIFSQEELSGN